MNKVQRLLDELDTRRRYHVPGSTISSRRPVDAVYISAANSVLHELGKALGAYMVRKWGDVKITPAMVKLLIALNDEVNRELKDFPKDGGDFITEAVPDCDESKRRDLVKCFGNVPFEFETCPRRAARFKDDESVVVIPLWIEKNGKV